MAFLVILAVLLAIAVFVTVPLRRQRNYGEADAERALEAERVVQDLEAARDAKYREIKDAELDRGTGKLSDADWEALDGSLRAEAIALLKQLDQARSELQRRQQEIQALAELSEEVSAADGEPDGVRETADVSDD